MELNVHPDFKVSRSFIGSEKAPLLVVDNFVGQPDSLVAHAVEQQYVRNSPFYPGVRADAPAEYKQLFLDELQDTLIDYFQIPCTALKFNICHYSMVTTPATRLKLLQSIPHFDSTDVNGLAAVHYLFKADLGGTSFYRHKKTGFESIDESRKLDYFRSLEGENGRGSIPKPGYINGDTELYEQIAKQDGVFNRVVIYRRNSLHSGSISKDFIPDPNPLTGRLSINSFIDPV